MSIEVSASVALRGSLLSQINPLIEDLSIDRTVINDFVDDIISLPEEEPVSVLGCQKLSENRYMGFDTETRKFYAFVRLQELPIGGLKKCYRGLLWTGTKIKQVAIKFFKVYLESSCSENSVQYRSHIEKAFLEHNLLQKLSKHPYIKHKDKVYLLDNKETIPIVVEKLGLGGDLLSYAHKLYQTDVGFNKAIFNQLLVFINHIAVGLIYLHNNGIVHADIKPENIVIFTKGGEQIAKIIDFDGHVVLKDQERKLKKQQEILSKKFPLKQTEMIYQELIKDWKFGLEVPSQMYKDELKKRDLTLTSDRARLDVAGYLQDWWTWMKKSNFLFGGGKNKSDDRISNVPVELDEYFHYTTQVDNYALGALICNITNMLLKWRDWKDNYEKRVSKLNAIGQTLMVENYWERPDLETIIKQIGDLIMDDEDSADSCAAASYSEASSGGGGVCE